MASSTTQVPGQLQAVIDVAAKQYGVPADILGGIWRTETGSTFPNPWANGLGYGGEFGTAVTSPFGSASQTKRIVEPPYQQQANTAASVLASTLRSSGGNIASALSKYSGGGYTSVPGETTFGNFQGGYVTPQASPPSAAAGDAGTVSNASLVSGITGDVTGSIEEAILRLAELFFAAVLLYLGLKALQRALQSTPGYGELARGSGVVGGAAVSGAGAVGGGAKVIALGKGDTLGIVNGPIEMMRGNASFSR